MENQKKIINTGLMVSGMGIFVTPLFADRLYIVINLLIFIVLAVMEATRMFNERGITLKDVDANIEKKINESYQQKQYGSLILYASLRPLMLTGLIISIIYMVTFLVL